MVWGWLVASIFILFVGLAMAELASAAPTSGGLYFWTWTFSPPRYKKVLSWIVGCELPLEILRGIHLRTGTDDWAGVSDANTMGAIAGIASIDWGCSVQIMAAAAIGSDDAFVATTGKLFSAIKTRTLS